jgi:hypothetical protein
MFVMILAVMGNFERVRSVKKTVHQICLKLFQMAVDDAGVLSTWRLRNLSCDQEWNGTGKKELESLP